MQEEVLDQVESGPLYVVHIKGRRGTCSVAFTDPARALKSATDLLQHGFNGVRITNAAGETLAVEHVKRLAGQ